MGTDGKTKVQRGRKRWTEEEDTILHDEAMKQSTTGNVRDWHRIATRLPGRTNKDCRKRWVNKVCGGLKKGLWDPEEDQRLQAAVEKHGLKWPLIAAEVGFRSPDQCSKRWQYGLDPRLKHHEWTAEEDQLLLQLVQERGREWKAIQHNHYPSRSRIDLKNRYTILMRRMTNNSNPDVLGDDSHDAYQDDDDGSDSSSVVSGASEDGTAATDGASTSTAPTSHGSQLRYGRSRSKGHSKTSSVSSVQHQYAQPYATDWLGSAMYNAGLEASGHSQVDSVVDGDMSMSMAGFSFDGHVAVSSALGQEILTSAWDDPFSAGGGLQHSDKPMSGYHLNMASFGGPMTAGGEGDVEMGMHQAVFDPEMLTLRMDDSSGAMQVEGQSSQSSAMATVTIDVSERTAEGSSQAGVMGPGEQEQEGGGAEDDDLSKVVIAVEGCDKDTLDYLFNVTRPIKGRVKMEITM